MNGHNPTTFVSLDAGAPGPYGTARRARRASAHSWQDGERGDSGGYQRGGADAIVEEAGTWPSPTSPPSEDAAAAQCRANTNWNPSRLAALTELHGCLKAR